MYYPWKGRSYLLKAFVGLADHSACLLIVGDKPQRAALDKLVPEFGLKQWVFMPGNQSDLVPWLQALDVFVLPSFANVGVPQAFLRAMRCGIPVISTATGSIIEAVRDKETGPIAPEEQSDALRETLENLPGDAEPRLRFGDSARKVAQEKFGIEAMLVRMEAVFSEAAGG